MNAPDPHADLRIPTTAQLSIPALNIHAKPLSEKAMLVRLTISKPRTSKRDEAAEQFTQTSLADAGLRVSTTLFKDKSSPVRQLFAKVSAVYQYHKTNTLPYVDRGPRLLPAAQYEKYRDDMRALIADVDKGLGPVLADYPQLVAADIAARGPRASIADYPTVDEFGSSMTMEFSFSPLPDNRHWLFDVSEEDKEDLDRQIETVIFQAHADMKQRIAEPTRHLIEKLRIPAGQPGAIFRDTAVENIVDAVANVRQLCMDDEELLRMCDEVSAVIKPHAQNIDVLRESPVVREQALARLKAVADKMGFMAG